MENLVIYFAAAAALAGLLASIALWAPRQLWIKLSALTATALFLPASYVSLADLLSRPKPIHFEWSEARVSKADVLSARLEEDEAIYLWLAIDGVQEPRAYVMPWDQEMARQLHDAQRRAEAEGSAVRMNQPFEKSWDKRERKFYAAPQPPAPMKDVPPQNPEIFKKSGLQRDAALAR